MKKYIKESLSELRSKLGTREWNQEKDILPVESSQIKLDDGMFTVLVGKCGHPAKCLTGKVVFPNSSEPKVRISWFGRQEEWKPISQAVFGEEVTALKGIKKHQNDSRGIHSSRQKSGIC